MEIYQIILTIIAGLVGFYVLFSIAITILMFNKAFLKKQATGDLLKQIELYDKKVPEELYYLPYDELHTKSDFGYDLCARLYRQNDDHKWVILAHGLGSGSSAMVRYMTPFRQKGFNCLIPDHRHSAKSGGTSNTFGFYETPDIIRWIEYIYSIDKDAEIGIMGESMGAATAMMTAGRRPDLKFIVEYCGYSDLTAQFADEIKNFLPFAKILFPIPKLAVRLYCGFKWSSVRPAEEAKNIKCPMLIMHSRADERVNFYHHEIVKKSVPHARVKTFEDSKHGRSQTVHREEFEGAITAFLTDNNF